MSTNVSNWWDDQLMLHRHQLSSTYDYANHEVIFQYAIRTGVNRNEYKLFNVNIDLNELQLGVVKLEDMQALFRYRMQTQPDYRHPGPTVAQLQQYPALAVAWREYQTIHKLTLGDAE